MSLVSGLAINIVACLVLGGLLAFVRKTWMLVLLSVSIPFASAASIYWGAVYATSGNASGEHSQWAGLFIGTWAVPAYLALALGLLAGRSIRKNGASANKEFKAPPFGRLGPTQAHACSGPLIHSVRSKKNGKEGI